MHHNIQKEKREFNIISSSLVSRNNNNNNNFIIKTTNAQRPDTLEIKVKPDNVVKIISKSDNYIDNVSGWSGDSLDNFILQIKNANNTPSPITPNSFFNPSDVTQDQEQFADALTLHLNKIKEDYKSSIEPIDSPHLSNIIQITSMSHEKSIPMTTVSLGNKVFLLNQISHNNTSNDNQCVNYSLMDIPSDISKPAVQPPIQISQIHSIRENTKTSVLNPQTLLCPRQNIQFSPNQNNELNQMVQPISNESNEQINHPNLYKPDSVVYSCLSDSSHTDLLNRIYPNIVNHNNNIGVYLKPESELGKRSLSTSSNDNDSSYGTNDSSAKTRQMDCSSNGSKLQIKDDNGVDDMQRRLERKRARNRDAARKCRDRKNGLISTLEQKYAKQSAEKDMIREKLLKSLEEIRRLTEYISKHDPHSTFANFTSFLSEIKINELTEADLKDLNLL